MSSLSNSRSFCSSRSWQFSWRPRAPHFSSGQRSFAMIRTFPAAADFAGLVPPAPHSTFAVVLCPRPRPLTWNWKSSVSKPEKEKYYEITWHPFFSNTFLYSIKVLTVVKGGHGLTLQGKKLQKNPSPTVSIYECFFFRSAGLSQGWKGKAKK